MFRRLEVEIVGAKALASALAEAGPGFGGFVAFETVEGLSEEVAGQHGPLREGGELAGVGEADGEA